MCCAAGSEIVVYANGDANPMRPQKLK